MGLGTIVLVYVENITRAIDKKRHTIGVFIDLCKAFDTIYHSLLLQKLEWDMG